MLQEYMTGDALQMYSNTKNNNSSITLFRQVRWNLKAVTDVKSTVSELMTDRQRCAIWIKKLCDPATCGSSLTDRKNRNMYARLLLHMLKRGILEGPFTTKPEPGKLKTLPAYMV